MIYFWIFFHVFLLVALYVDGWYLQKKQSSPLRCSLFWIVLSLVFAVCIALFSGIDNAITFCTAYFVEKTLSLDNLFVFLSIFSFFSLTTQEQKKVLFFGIAGAMLFRIVFILGGIALLRHFSFLYFVCGAFLVVSAFFLLIVTKKKKIQDYWMMKMAKRYLPLELELPAKGRFFIRKQGKLYCTSLFLCVLLVETTDVLFAIDSIPAVLAITMDPFLAYTSNVFAILGLRALYFLLHSMHKKFSRLEKGIAFLLLFIGLKMLLSPFFALSSLTSLVIMLCILLICMRNPLKSR